MTDIVLVALVVLSALCFFFLMRRQGSRASAAEGQSLLLMQQQVESLRLDVRESLQHATENVNRQLALVTQQIQSQTHSVGDRLDSAARVIGDVQRNLGELGKATQEIKELGQSVSKLDELLSAPKLRGGLGEFLLEDLLRQVLPAEHFTMQYRFRNGGVVDAIIQTSDRIACVDSKFPLENFRKVISATGDIERRGHQKAFANDVKKHIDAIAEKYILPEEGTLPFALMYIPAENIYYEVIIKDEAANDSLHSYALARKVVPVSPNSFYAYLQVIALGLRGLSIEESARDIQDGLAQLHGDVAQLREVFDTMGTHLENARKKFDDADKRLSRFEGKFDRIAGQQLPAGNGLTPALEEAKLLV